MAMPKQTGPQPKPTAKPTVAAVVDSGATLKKADAAIEKGEFAEALSLLTPLPEDLPGVQPLIGYAYSGQQNFPAAVTAFEKALKKGPDPRILYSLGYLYEQLGDFEKARQAYQELTKVTLPPKVMAKVQLGLAKSLVWSDDLKAAIAAFRQAIKLDPALDEAFISLFKTLKTAGTAADVHAAAEIGDTHHSEKFDYSFWKALALYDLGDDAKALQAFRKCIELNPENTSPFYYSYRILRKSRRIEESLKELQKAFKIHPAMPYVFFQAALDAKNEKRLDLAFSFLRGSLLFDRTLLGRDDQNTISEVRKFIEKKGTPEEKKFLPVFMDYVNGDVKNAKSTGEALLNSLKDPGLLADLQRLLRQCNQVIGGENAYLAYQESLRSQEQADALARLKNRMTPPKPGEKESPADLLKRQALSNPRDAKLQYGTALKLAAMGDIDGAKTFLRETIRANPNVSEAHYSLAKLSLHEGNPNDAIESLKFALQVRPDNSQARSLLAATYLENGEVDRAADEARAALAANPANPEARYVLAEAYLKKQNTEKALEHIENGLEVENDPARRVKLEALKQQLTSGN
jgi:tetratricopeptide (TPR) repeat protein